MEIRDTPVELNDRQRMDLNRRRMREDNIRVNRLRDQQLSKKILIILIILILTQMIFK